MERGVQERVKNLGASLESLVPIWGPANSRNCFPGPKAGQLRPIGGPRRAVHLGKTEFWGTTAPVKGTNFPTLEFLGQKDLGIPHRFREGIIGGPGGFPFSPFKVKLGLRGEGSSIKIVPPLGGMNQGQLRKFQGAKSGEITLPEGPFSGVKNLEPCGTSRRGLLAPKNGGRGNRKKQGGKPPKKMGGVQQYKTALGHTLKGTGPRGPRSAPICPLCVFATPLGRKITPPPRRHTRREK